MCAHRCSASSRAACRTSSAPRARSTRRRGWGCSWSRRWRSRRCSSSASPSSSSTPRYVHGMLEHAPHACMHICIQLSRASVWGALRRPRPLRPALQDRLLLPRHDPARRPPRPHDLGLLRHVRLRLVRLPPGACRHACHAWCVHVHVHVRMECASAHVHVWSRALAGRCTRSRVASSSSGTSSSTPP